MFSGDLTFCVVSFSIMGAILSAAYSLVDQLYYLLRIFAPGRPRYFKDGWGDMDTARKLAADAVDFMASGEPGKVPWAPVVETLAWGSDYPMKSPFAKGQRGSFRSPLHDALPEPSKHCHFVFVYPSTMKFPLDKSSNSNLRGIVIFLPAVGEQGSGDRVEMAELLAKDSVASIIITSPFYGIRRPPNQPMHYVRNVGDFWVQGTALMQEAALLTCWAAETFPGARLCTSGFSWGGAMSSGTALMTSQWVPQSGSTVSVAPYAGSATPAVIIDGLLEDDIDWTAIGGHSDAKPKLMRVFDKAHLCTLTEAILSNGKSTARLGDVCSVSFQHDGFIKREYSVDLFERLVGCSHTGTPCKLRWSPGGHIAAYFMKGRLQLSSIRTALRIALPT